MYWHCDQCDSEKEEEDFSVIILATKKGYFTMIVNNQEIDTESRIALTLSQNLTIDKNPIVITILKKWMANAESGSTVDLSENHKYLYFFLYEGNDL